MKTKVLLWVLFSLLGVLALCYLFVPMPSAFNGLLLKRRLIKLAVMLLVTAVISVSTIGFQSLVGNRYLTPGVLGLESLFVLIQTVLYLGQEMIGIEAKASIVLAMMAILVQGMFFVMVYHLFRKFMRLDFQVVLLVSLALGTLFRSASSFVQVLLDPNEYDQLQAKLFPSFQRMNAQPVLVGILAVIAAVLMVWVFSRHRVFDVFHLGETQAFLLGVDVDRFQWWLLLAIVILSAISTVLVGPMMFFGFIIANVTYQLIHDYRHSVLWGGAFLIGANLLVGGQWLIEKVFHFNFPISVVIEWVGGLVYLYLILKGRKANGTSAR